MNRVEKAGDSPLRSGESSEVTSAEKILLTGPPTTEAEPRHPDAGRKVARNQLINRLNFIHFKGDRIQIHLVDRHTQRRLSLAALPFPVCGSEMVCRWDHPGQDEAVLRGLDLDFIRVPHGQSWIHSVPLTSAITTEGARLKLPDFSYEINQRTVERQPCRDITVQVFQKACVFAGRLVDFNAFSFKAELDSASPQSCERIDPQLPVKVVFLKAAETFFRAECLIIRCTHGEAERSYVMQPLAQQIHRYPKAEIRSQRIALTPSPNLVFQHPLTGRRVDLKVINLSGSGFAVEECEPAAVLMPGLTLPRVELRFANSLTLTCRTQVLYRNTVACGGSARLVRCGLSLMEMPAQDHLNLLAMLHQSVDRNAFICNALDPEALWDFFFETGFIYPDKYTLLHKQKEKIKETCRKIYHPSQAISRHFVYQDNGVILGHVAMIRFWQRTWLIHHHAARRAAINKAGLLVLDQLSRFIQETRCVGNLHMDHLACYYRPQNRFPQRFFGGFAQSFNDPANCSIDLFAYLRISHQPFSEEALSDRWQLLPAVDKDVVDLTDFYNDHSGGLTLKAMDLEPAGWGADNLSQDYRRVGLKWERHWFALRHGGRLKAFIIANVSDIGLNFSDLTSCLQVIVTDAEGLDPDIFIQAVRRVSRVAGLQEIAVLVYPAAYPQDLNIPFEKSYNLWIVDTAGTTQAFLKYLSRFTRYR